MGRSTKKGFYVDPKLAEKIDAMNASGGHKTIRTWSRKSTITPDFVGLNFEIHNGKLFVPLHVTENMVGHCLGEFAPTRTFKGHNPHTQK